MFKLLSKFFQRKSNTAGSAEDSRISTPNASADEYFIRELIACPYIKSEAHERVLKHFRHEESLTKTGNKLTLEEKKKIGLNPRLSITRELIEILNEDGIALANPKQLLNDLYNKATIEKLRDESFARSLSAGIKRFKFLASLENCCEWCERSHEKEFGVDIIDLLKSECSCKPYCGGVIISKIEL